MKVTGWPQSLFSRRRSERSPFGSQPQCQAIPGVSRTRPQGPAIVDEIWEWVTVFPIVAFHDQEIRKGRTQVRGTDVEQWASTSVRRSRNQVGISHVGNLLSLGHSPAPGEIVHDYSASSALKELTVLVPGSLDLIGDSPHSQSFQSFEHFS